MNATSLRATAICALAAATLIGTSALAQLWNQPTLMPADSGGGSVGPITFVGSGALGQSSGSTNSLSASYAVSAGTNEGLVLCTGEIGSTVSSVTYNGASATQLATFNTGYYPQDIWYIPLGNTSAGSHTLTITTAATATIVGVVGEYAKIQQTASPDGSNHVASSGTTYISVTTTTSGDWVMICTVNTAPQTAGSGDVLRQNNNNGGAGNPNLFDSNGAVPAGSNSFTINSNADMQAVGLRPG
jgi:hypothetical protein